MKRKIHLHVSEDDYEALLIPIIGIVTRAATREAMQNSEAKEDGKEQFECKDRGFSSNASFGISCGKQDGQAYL